MIVRCFIGAGLSLFAGAAIADPCEAPLPRRAGEVFSGQVEYIGDGDSLCVRARGGLIEVRLADFDAPERGEPGWREAKRWLTTLARYRWTVCTVTPGRSGRTTSFDRTIALCRIGGRPIGDLMRSRRAPEGGL